MASGYDPLFSPAAADEDDLAPVRERFQEASAPYLRSPWSWLTWAVVLPVAAGMTARLGSAGVGGRWGDARRLPAFVLMIWSAAILIGGAVEVVAIRRARGGRRATTIAAW